MALAEPNSRYNVDSIGVKAIKNKDEYLVNGIKLFVPYAQIADYLICVARTNEEVSTSDGISLFIIDNKSLGITCKVPETIAMDKKCEVMFDNTRVPKENILGVLDRGWASLEKPLQKATVALCAEMIGGIEQVLEMTVDYAKQRVLFGRPLGSFQIIQSHCVKMLSLLEDSRLLTYEAGWKLSEGIPCAKEVSMAKAQASEAYRTITTLGHGIHGGTAYCVDHDMNLYYRRAKSADVSFGDADSHREKIVVELGL
jgi:alkylation response protein AidB-like acyl-CoA dehydrogenase